MDKDNLPTATATAIPSAPPCYNIIFQPYYQVVVQDEEDNLNEEESLLQNNFNNIELSTYNDNDNDNLNKSNTIQEPKKDIKVPSPLDNVNYETTNYEIPQEHGIGEPYTFGEKIDFPKFKSIYDK